MNWMRFLSETKWNDRKEINEGMNGMKWNGMEWNEIKWMKWTEERIVMEGKERAWNDMK